MKKAFYVFLFIAISVAKLSADVTSGDGFVDFKQLIKNQVVALQCLALNWTVTQTLNAQDPVENVIDYNVSLLTGDKFVIEQKFDHRNLFRYIGNDRIVYTISDQQKHIAVADNPRKVLGDIIEGIPIVFLNQVLDLDKMGKPSELRHENGGLTFVWKASKGSVEIQFSESTRALNKISITKDGVERLSYVCAGNSVLNGLIPEEVTLTKRKADSSLYLSQHWKLISGDYNPLLRKIDLSYPLPKGYAIQYVVAGKRFESQTDDLLPTKDSK